MTTYYEKEIICAICKNKSTYEMTSSFNAFGSCDLDTRPPEMQRSTMQYWTQRCPDCGYCAIDISVSEENMVEIVKSSKYQNQLKEDIDDLLTKILHFQEKLIASSDKKCIR
ncbi:unnamed protein product [marine sediment metagenome]|uniref:Uncharacterized protein n=1 Tax=marine sediment metagenome TaxID=412755 RepID=X0ZKW8_9ZZZZ